MKFITLLFFISTLACTTWAQDSATIIQVGKTKITKRQFNQKYNDLAGKVVSPPTKRLFMEDLIRYEIGLQEARKKNIQNDPRVVEQVREIVYRGLIEKELGRSIQKIKVSDREMKSFYQKNPEIRTSHILIELKPNSPIAAQQETKSRAEAIYKKVAASKQPFSESVRLYSDDTLTKDRGGDIGYQSKVALDPNYYAAAQRLKKGQLSSLIRTPYGYHIIQLTGRNSFSKANKQFIKAAIYDAKRKRIFDRYFTNLKKKYSIQANPALLK